MEAQKTEGRLVTERAILYAIMNTADCQNNGAWYNECQYQADKLTRELNSLYGGNLLNFPQ